MWLACVAASLRLDAIRIAWDGVSRTPLPSLTVGRSSGGADVVRGGLRTALPLAQPGYAHRAHYFVGARSSADGPVAALGVRAESNTSALAARASLEGALPGTAEVWVDLTCSRAGAAEVTVTLELAPPFLSPQWAFAKTCLAQPHLGLQVGQAPLGSDLVSAGTAQGPWASGAMVVPYAAFELALYVTLTRDAQASLAPLEPTVQLVDSPAAATALLAARARRLAGGAWSGLAHARAPPAAQADLVRVKGALAGGGALENNGTSVLVLLEFSCVHPGSYAVDLAVEVFPAYQPYRPAAISFVKVCGGEERIGFNLGTAAGAADLILDGKVVGLQGDMDNVADSTEFFLSYTPLSPEDPDQGPDLTVTCLSIVGEEIVDLTVQAAPDKIGIQYECVHLGLAFCKMSFKFKMWKPPQPVTWTKACGGLRKDIVITSSLKAFPLALSNGKVAEGWNVTLPPDDDSIRLHVNASVPVNAKVRLTTTPTMPWAIGPPLTRLMPAGTDLELDAPCGSLTGTVRAMVELEMPGYEPVALPFRKACEPDIGESGAWTHGVPRVPGHDSYTDALYAAAALAGLAIVSVAVIWITRSARGGGAPS